MVSVSITVTLLLDRASPPVCRPPPAQGPPSPPPLARTAPQCGAGRAPHLEARADRREILGRSAAEIKPNRNMKQNMVIARKQPNTRRCCRIDCCCARLSIATTTTTATMNRNRCCWPPWIGSWGSSPWTTRLRSTTSEKRERSGEGHIQQNREGAEREAENGG